jgi:hypothetical protein
MLDTLKYVNILESKGFTREQAEAQVSLVKEIMNEELATKHDLKDLKNELVKEIATVNVSVAMVRNELSEKMLGLSVEMHKLHNKTIFSLAGIIGIFFALEKFIKF